MSSLSLLLLFCGGLVTGTVGALLGIGGGLFLVPFLVLVVGVPMHQAVATSLIAVIATSSAAAAVNVERGLVNVRLGMVLEIASVFGAIVGALVAHGIDERRLSKIFAVIMLAVALLMWYRLRKPERAAAVPRRGRLSGAYFDDAANTVVPYGVRRIRETLGISLFAGTISGLLGVGGGIFKVPAMHLISGVPMKVATATSNFMIGVTAAASAFLYFAHGNINPVLSSSAVLGVFLGSMAGIVLAKRIQGRTLTILFIIVLIVVSIQMFAR
jgi:uncharacterized membrane protein YfcA